MQEFVPPETLKTLKDIKSISIPTRLPKVVTKREATVPYRANSDVFNTLRSKRRKEKPKRVTQKGAYKGAHLDHLIEDLGNGRQRVYHATKGWREERA